MLLIDVAALIRSTKAKNCIRGDPREKREGLPRAYVNGALSCDSHLTVSLMAAPGCTHN